MIKTQLENMNIDYDSINLIRSKDGVHVCRVKSKNKSYVLKYFEKPEYRREIKNYLLLQKLGIPTIPIIAYTDKSILMEDIEKSEKYRLGIKEDLCDTEICRHLAEWYKLLHNKGKEYVKKYGSGMYAETDCITAENIDFIKSKTHTENYPVWIEIERSLPYILSLIKNTEKTLTYNDFYYTNMVVAKDKSQAFMFDYNLLGKGSIASDIINVTSSLSKEAGTAFLNAYGKINNRELLLNNVAGTLVSLYFASCREEFPQWAADELESIKNGKLLNKLKVLTI